MVNGTDAVTNTPDLIFTRASITLEYRSQAQKSLEGSLLESRRNESGKIKLILLLFIVGIAAFFLWREISAAPPEVRLGREIKGISRSTELGWRKRAVQQPNHPAKHTGRS